MLSGLHGIIEEFTNNCYCDGLKKFAERAVFAKISHEQTCQQFEFEFGFRNLIQSDLPTLWKIS